MLMKPITDFAKCYEPFWDGKTKEDSRRELNVAIRSSDNQLDLLLLSEDELIYIPNQDKTKTESHVKRAKSLMEK